jgi:gamma-glutamyl phosphate reductase
MNDTRNELQNHKQNYEHKYISAMLKTLYKSDSIIPRNGNGLSRLLMYHQQIHIIHQNFGIVTADCAYHD